MLPPPFMAIFAKWVISKAYRPNFLALRCFVPAHPAITPSRTVIAVNFRGSPHFRMAKVGQCRPPRCNRAYPTCFSVVFLHVFRSFDCFRFKWSADPLRQFAECLPPVNGVRRRPQRDNVPAFVLRVGEIAPAVRPQIKLQTPPWVASQVSNAKLSGHLYTCRK